MWNSLLRDRLLIFLFFAALLLKLFSLNESWVERYYSTGLYPHISSFLRLLLGWIPFSVGDILYILAFFYLIWKVWKLLRLLVKRRMKEYLSWILFGKYLKLVLWIYLIFNLFWGLNYNRVGIAGQLGLEVKPYTTEELYQLTEVLQQRVNHYAALVHDHRKIIKWKDSIFSQGVRDFRKSVHSYPFLEYNNPSIKPSLFGSSGKYFGYTGYYNPFTGEAQLKTSIPFFMMPFVLNHEIGHQLGYAKENEASFVSWLTAKNSDNVRVRYSIYYELFYDAFLQYFRSGNRLQALTLYTSMHPRVLKDKEIEAAYLRRTRNAIEPFMSGAYDRYLKLNNQPKGKATYNEVIAWLIAYMKKYGAQKI